ncbi:MAG: hypothetical protein KGL35_32695 [Bradyrhizobium sp.]|nr:hypothetical protein [Bradyrhizobium sp.]
MKAVDLATGRPNACQFDYGTCAQENSRSQRKVLQLKSDGRDVLAKKTGPDGVPAMAKLGKQFGRKEMDLTFVGKRRDHPPKKSAPRILSRMRVSFDSVRFDESNFFLQLLRKAVLGIARYAQYLSITMIHLLRLQEPARSARSLLSPVLICYGEF